MFILNLIVALILSYQLATYDIFNRKTWFWIGQTYFLVPLLIGLNFAHFLFNFINWIGA